MTVFNSCPEVDTEFNASSIPDCSNPSFLSCQMALVNFEALLSGKEIKIFGKNEDNILMSRTKEMDSVIGDGVTFIYEVIIKFSLFSNKGTVFFFYIVL